MTRNLTLTLKRVLHSGKLRKLLIPNEKRKFQFPLNPKEVSERFPLNETDKVHPIFYFLIRNVF